MKHHKKDDCNQPLRPGKCISYRAYYDKEQNKCHSGFTYGICVIDSDVNNFETLEECEKLCVT